MLDVPEFVKHRCRGDNNRTETVKHLELSFFNGGVDTLYPANDLYPADNLYPSDAGTPWLTIPMSQICAETLNLTESLSSGSNIVWGSCEAAKFVVTVADVDEEIEGREFTATLSIGDYKMAYGIYVVDSVVKQADRRKRKITAYDRMIKFDVDVSDWYHAMYPTDDTTHTIQELRDSLCEHIGVPQQQTVLINDEMVVGKTISPESLCGRDVLKAICEINGVFGHFDRTGMLTYISLQDTGLYPSDTLYPGYDLYPQSGWAAAEELEYYRSITYEDYLIDGIDRVQVRQEDGDIGAVVGSGSNAYIVEGNFLAYGLGSADLTKLAWSIYDSIAGKTYRPAKIVSYAMPWIEVGDGLRAITTDTEIATFVLTRTMSGIQAMMDTVEAKGTKTQGQSFGVENEIIQLKGKTAVIVRNVDEVSATVTDLEKHTTAQLKVVSDQITAEVKRATDQEVELAAAISVAADKIDLKVSKGDVCTQITAESSNGGQIILNAPGALIINAGNTKLDAGGHMELTGATFHGCINTGSMGADVINANHVETDRLNCDGSMTVNGSATLNGITYANRISCYSIYSELAGSTWSDKRLKKGIRDIALEDARSLIMGLKGVTYKTKRSGMDAMGFVAQDVVKLLHKLGLSYPLVDRHDGYLALQYQNLIPLIIAFEQAQHQDTQQIVMDIKQIKEDLYGK
ncbi:MAG: tail fiber domain-containing protein [Enterocloster bolteae]